MTDSVSSEPATRRSAQGGSPAAPDYDAMIGGGKML